MPSIKIIICDQCNIQMSQSETPLAVKANQDRFTIFRNPHDCPGEPDAQLCGDRCGSIYLANWLRQKEHRSRLNDIKPVEQVSV